MTPPSSGGRRTEPVGSTEPPSAAAQRSGSALTREIERRLDQMRLGDARAVASP